MGTPPALGEVLNGTPLNLWCLTLTHSRLLDFAFVAVI
jgi:hypothetical protein